MVDKDLQYGSPVAEADQKSKNRRKFAKKLLRTTDTGIIKKKIFLAFYIKTTYILLQNEYLLGAPSE